VNRSKTEAASVMIGKSLGIPIPPLIILIIEIPTAMIRKTTANPTDNADVNLNESAKRMSTCIDMGGVQVCHKTSKTMV
jgi:hypothetical protein